MVNLSNMKPQQNGYARTRKFTSIPNFQNPGPTIEHPAGDQSIPIPKHKFNSQDGPKKSASFLSPRLKTFPPEDMKRLEYKAPMFVPKVPADGGSVQKYDPKSWQDRNHGHGDAMTISRSAIEFPANSIPKSESFEPITRPQRNDTQDKNVVLYRTETPIENTMTPQIFNRSLPLERISPEMQQFQIPIPNRYEPRIISHRCMGCGMTSPQDLAANNAKNSQNIYPRPYYGSFVRSENNGGPFYHPQQSMNNQLNFEKEHSMPDQRPALVEKRNKKVLQFTPEMITDQETLVRTMRQQDITEDLMRRHFTALLNEQKKQLLYNEQWEQRGQENDKREEQIIKRGNQIDDQKPEWMVHITPSRISYDAMEKLKQNNYINPDEERDEGYPVQYCRDTQSENFVDNTARTPGTVRPSSLLKLRNYNNIIRPQKCNNGLQDLQSIRKSYNDSSPVLPRQKALTKLNGIQNTEDIVRPNDEIPIQRDRNQIISANGLENYRHSNNPITNPLSILKKSEQSAAVEYPRQKQLRIDPTPREEVQPSSYQHIQPYNGYYVNQGPIQSLENNISQNDCSMQNEGHYYFHPVHPQPRTIGGFKYNARNSDDLSQPTMIPNGCTCHFS